MTVQSFLNLRWQDEEKPLINPTFPSPLAADPSFLFPEEVSDGLWHMFAHSAFGIKHYTSKDGINWADIGTVVWNAMRCFVRRIDGLYCMYFEKYPPLQLMMTIRKNRKPWRSEIQVMTSKDLYEWSKPVVAIKPEEPWTRDSRWGASVSNPCLIDVDGVLRLYFSASLVHVPDCGFEEPKYIALAERSRSLGVCGTYTVHPKPLLSPENDPMPGLLGSGAMKVLAFEDGYIGLQNKIYHDGAGQSRSAQFLLKSNDGIEWQSARDTPLIEPSTGWRATHVYACDCRYRKVDATWYLYYNARDYSHKGKGIERIGRITARM